MADLIVVVAALPPPMGGAAKNTKIIADRLSSECKTLVLNTSVGKLAHDRSLYYHFKRLKKTIQCSFTLACQGRFNNKVLYIVPDGGLGLFYTALYLIMARLFGYDVVFHHRTFLYIDKKSALMDFCAKLVRKKLFHVFLSPGMRDGYLKNYPFSVGTLISDNARFVEPEIKNTNVSDLINLGHLSNLCDEKGFYEVIAIFNYLKKTGLNIKLHLAGAPVNDSVKSDLDQFLMNNKESVIYYHHIDGAEKENFYRNVDFFIFPTKFKQEAQPNVLYEALAKGAICISWGRACIPEMYNSECGLVVAVEEDIIFSASNFIIELTNSTELLNVYRENVYKHISDKKKTSLEQYEKMISAICGDLEGFE